MKWNWAALGGSQQAFCLENRFLFEPHQVKDVLGGDALTQRRVSLSASIKSFYFSVFFLSPFNISDKEKKWFGVYVTTSFLYIPPHHWPLQRGICEFSVSFFWQSSSVLPKGIFHLVFATSPMSNSSCFLCKTHAADISGCDFYFFSPPPFSLTSGPLRLGVKKCNIFCRLLVWEVSLCICPDGKVLTHSEGRTQRRSGCAAALCDLKAICTGQDFFFFASGAKQMGLESVDCVCNRLFHKADILTCYSQNSLSNEVLIPLKFPGLLWPQASRHNSKVHRKKKARKRQGKKKLCGRQPCLLALLVTAFSTSAKFSECLDWKCQGMFLLEASRKIE